MCDYVRRFASHAFADAAFEPRLDGRLPPQEKSSRPAIVLWEMP